MDSKAPPIHQRTEEKLVNEDGAPTMCSRKGFIRAILTITIVKEKRVVKEEKGMNRKTESHLKETENTYEEAKLKLECSTNAEVAVTESEEKFKNKNQTFVENVKNYAEDRNNELSVSVDLLAQVVEETKKTQQEMEDSNNELCDSVVLSGQVVLSAQVVEEAKPPLEMEGRNNELSDPVVLSGQVVEEEVKPQQEPDISISSEKEEKIYEKELKQQQESDKSMDSTWTGVAPRESMDSEVLLINQTTDEIVEVKRAVNEKKDMNGETVSPKETENTDEQAKLKVECSTNVEAVVTEAEDKSQNTAQTFVEDVKNDTKANKKQLSGSVVSSTQVVEEEKKAQQDNEDSDNELSDSVVLSGQVVSSAQAVEEEAKPQPEMEDSNNELSDSMVLSGQVVEEDVKSQQEPDISIYSEKGDKVLEEESKKGKEPDSPERLPASVEQEEGKVEELQVKQPDPEDVKDQVVSGLANGLEDEAKCQQEADISRSLEKRDEVHEEESKKQQEHDIAELLSGSVKKAEGNVEELLVKQPESEAIKDRVVSGVANGFEEEAKRQQEADISISPEKKDDVHEEESKKQQESDTAELAPGTVEKMEELLVKLPECEPTKDQVVSGWANDLEEEEKSQQEFAISNSFEGGDKSYEEVSTKQNESDTPELSARSAEKAKWNVKEFLDEQPEAEDVKVQVASMLANGLEEEVKPQQEADISIFLERSEVHEEERKESCKTEDSVEEVAVDASMSDPTVVNPTEPTFTTSAVGISEETVEPEVNIMNSCQEELANVEESVVNQENETKSANEIAEVSTIEESAIMSNEMDQDKDDSVENKNDSPLEITCSVKEVENFVFVNPIKSCSATSAVGTDEENGELEVKITDDKQEAATEVEESQVKAQLVEAHASDEPLEGKISKSNSLEDEIKVEDTIVSENIDTILDAAELIEAAALESSGIAENSDSGFLAQKDTKETAKEGTGSYKTEDLVEEVTVATSMTDATDINSIEIIVASSAAGITDKTIEPEANIMNDNQEALTEVGESIVNQENETSSANGISIVSIKEEISIVSKEMVRDEDGNLENKNESPLKIICSVNQAKEAEGASEAAQVPPKEQNDTVIVMRVEDTHLDSLNEVHIEIKNPVKEDEIDNGTSESIPLSIGAISAIQNAEETTLPKVEVAKEKQDTLTEVEEILVAETNKIDYASVTAEVPIEGEKSNVRIEMIEDKKDDIWEEKTSMDIPDGLGAAGKISFEELKGPDDADMVEEEKNPSQLAGNVHDRDSGSLKDDNITSADTSENLVDGTEIAVVSLEGNRSLEGIEVVEETKEENLETNKLTLVENSNHIDAIAPRKVDTFTIGTEIIEKKCGNTRRNEIISDEESEDPEVIQEKAEKEDKECIMVKENKGEVTVKVVDVKEENVIVAPTATDDPEKYKEEAKDKEEIKNSKDENLHLASKCDVTVVEGEARKQEITVTPQRHSNNVISKVKQSIAKATRTIVGNCRGQKVCW